MIDRGKRLRSDCWKQRFDAGVISGQESPSIDRHLQTTDAIARWHLFLNHFGLSSLYETKSPSHRYDWLQSVRLLQNGK